MENIPKVSIIMPCFMARKTLENSIESVLSQTYKNFELIVVDDGSTDNSTAVILDYVNSDQRVKLFNNRFGKGVSGARNTGIEKAKGDFICFLDADDLWLENKLEAQIYFMENNSYYFSYSNYSTFKDEPGNIVKSLIFSKSLTYDDLIKSCDIGCLTACYNSRVLGKFYFDNVPKEDYLYWLKILKSYPVAYNVGENLALYRRGGKSLSSNKFKELPKQLNIIRNIEGYSLIMSLYFLLFYIWKGIKKI